jgi:hypothetical protein
MTQGASNHPAAASASASGIRSTEPTLLVESQTGFEPIPLKATTTIGRDRKNDVVIDHPTASRFHAKLWKDARGWHYQDLGSANGTKLGDSKLHSIIDLADGTALRIGRVRAYFFSAGVPSTWQPPEVGHFGKLLRCRCGHIGFAPQYTRGMTLNCAKCGRELVHSDSPVLHPSTVLGAPVTPRATINCAACHTSIEPTERLHTCDECGAQMHYSCHAELGGCATYGCSKVKHGEPDDAATTESALDSADRGVRAAPRSEERSGDSSAFRLAQCGLFVLAGLATFGVPAIAFAAHRLIATNRAMGRMRFVYAVIAFVGGALGFVLSAQLWLGGPTLWRFL